ncbi:MAG: DUF6602 domain-containing protein [Saprospiraceae bacterium]|nr:DUF6602 domain-containing protein [Saprospiraceae bacterium]
MSLSLYLEKLSEQIKAETAIIRSTFKNNTNKGTGFEIVIRNLISMYLPSRFVVTHGEMIDTFDKHSGQTDLLVVNQFHMRGHIDGRPNLVFYDLVTGLGEMKVYLNTDELRKIVDASNLLRGFQRHPDNNNMLLNNFYPDVQKPPPFFVIAFSSAVSPATLESDLRNTLISMLIVLSQDGTERGYIALGDTHNNIEVQNAMNNFGSRITSNVWKSSNPILGLIWGLNEFQVPFSDVTNMTPYYLK